MKNLLVILSFCFISQISFTQNSHQVDIDGVKEACMNYINTFYKADTTLAYKSIHSSLRKTGFYFSEEKGQYSKQLEMPFDALINLAKKWNADGKSANETTPKKVEIFEVSDKTAVAKVTAVWGIDYISLFKEGDTWMIVNVLWQSEPKFSER